MLLTLNIPEDIFEDVQDKLATQPGGVLKTIARNAVLSFLDTLREVETMRDGSICPFSKADRRKGE